jgi:TPR repeat protein
MAMPTADSHESLSAAYASNYDYIDSGAASQHHYHQHQQPQLHHSNSSATATTSSSSASASLTRAGGSVGSSGSQSYYSSATTTNQANQQQHHHQAYPNQYQHYHHQQYHQHPHPSPPTPAFRPNRQASSNYPEHAQSAALNPASHQAYFATPAPAISSSMYAQSNISMPALGAAVADPSVRAPPLADDLGDAFNGMNLYGTPKLGPQRARSPAYTAAAVSTSDAAAGKGAASAASVRANAMYANQEIHQSAAEVHPENSLAAIADQVDQAAADLDPNANLAASGPSHNDHSSQHHGSQYASGAGPSADANQINWDPMAAAAYYGSGGPSHAGAGAGGYPGFQPQPLHASACYAFAAGGAPPAPFPPAGAASGAYDSNPYFAAASGYLGFPEGAAPGFPPGADPYSASAAAAAAAAAAAGMMPLGGGGAGRPSMLTRQGTQMSMMSGTSASLGGLASNPRRKSKESSGPQQTLPFNKSFVAEYRQRMKGDPDPEAQFAYAKYLIEAAKKVHDPADGPKQQRKYRDTLLSESLKLIKRLATTGMGLGKPPYAEAQFFLANCFGNGSLGLQVDHEKAYNLYVQASKQNHPAATYRTAVCNEVGAGTRRDHHRAVLFYRKASALGDTAGMYKLGMVLLNGMLGQPRNVREAIVWLKRAAAQADEDNPHALHELGLLHEKSTNSVVLHDEAYARELFTHAAQLGYAPSQFKLGSAYEYGHLTCPVDPRRSIAWYTKAAGRGDGESELALSGWYLTGSEGVLKQSDSEAYLWARRAASKGIPKAEYAVGYYSEVGIGVNANLDEAKRWYMRAAAQGNKRAMQRLTELKKLKGSAAKGARPTRKDAESECTVM